jgi:hypothetical protein
MSRPATPEPIKRQLRQEAGYGCCKCGRPIYEYHHIVPYMEVPHSRPEDMMLLCPNHHRDATSGAMNECKQREYKENPHNIRKGKVNGILTMNQDFCAVIVGANEFIGNRFSISVDNDILFKIEIGQSGTLEISLKLYDQHNNLLATIQKNEWVSGDPFPWDIECSHQKLKIRSRVNRIDLEINAKEQPINIRGNLWKNKVNLQFNTTSFKIIGVVDGFNIAGACIYGGKIIVDTGSKNIVISPISAKKFGIRLGSTQEQRLKYGLDEWNKLIKGK